MKYIYLILVMIFFFSCKEKKIEFIQSKAYPNFFLIKNPPKEDSILKNEIIQFLSKKTEINIKNNYYRAVFYRYTSDTYYFVDNEEHDGGPTSSIFLSNYIDDKLATFIISKCENDTAKLVGRLYFYGIEGSSKGIGTIDTLIYNCQ